MKSKLNLANLPTKIEKLKRFSEDLGINLYIKRDDQTGTEFSGNKIRKLEYVLKEVVDLNYDAVITCGGIQSNHARATVAAATKIGLKSVVLLRTDEVPKVEGNYFLDKLLGADVRFCTSEEYKKSRAEIMKNIASEYALKGKKAYIIPEGASFGIGALGYYSAMEEIVLQEKEMGINFNTIVVATGSGGTYAGLYLANKIHGYGKRIIGMAVCDDAFYFKNVINEISNDALEYLDEEVDISKDEIEINDKYIGIGYAISTKEELDFITMFARKEGVILDPVYTGKAMRGLFSEVRNLKLKDPGNVLFIHTGGLFGLFPKQDQFDL
ncbi:MAG: D-cysteine desulfhydrase family protein [Rikenellaceae bacterium]|jgi:D-cysteine desulfhydrase|nr:D-cysteine desulfhydrase family protein [Bacteroidales bacterium]